MTPEPDPLVLATLVMAAVWTMAYAGIKKHALELKRRRRRCPSCGREIVGRTCSQH
jgi:hypothetical protein